MRYPFFVYGTLKGGESNYERYLAGRTREEIPASLDGAALYTAGPYPFLIREPGPAAPGDCVVGVLVSLIDATYDETLVGLDSLEDYVADRTGNMYERVVTEVLTAEGPRTAYVYVAGVEAAAAIHAGRMRKIIDGNWRAGS